MTNRARRAASHTTEDDQRKRVLVGDDESEICDLLSTFLSGEGYQVLEASTGKEALDILARQDGAPDVALLDIMSV